MFRKIRQSQHLLLWGVIALLSLILIFTLFLLFSSKEVRYTPKSPPKKMIATGATRINPQEVWVHDFSAKADLTQKRVDAVEQALEKLIKMNSQSQKSMIGPNIQKVAELQEDLKGNLVEQDRNQKTLPRPPGMNRNSQNVGSPKFQSKSLEKVSLNLRGRQTRESLKSVDNTIPAGTFAGATLLGGVDASTSIQASSDPRPILLRLTHAGTLPRRFQSDLEGCHVLAASYGDISSERVFMRLEKLSCVERKTGEVMEMNVQGYVAGEDGRAGILGSVVDRAGESMRNAMVGGFFSSVGKFLGQSKSPLLFSPSTGLAETNPLSTNDILKQSAGNGMSGALDRYADFYIKRAEQMQPVIQVSAGRVVDIVFTKGLDFSDSTVRKMLSKTNDQKRYQNAQNLSGQDNSMGYQPPKDDE